MAIAAAMWATDPYFRPALTKQLTASQIVFVESLLIALCFLPVAGRVRRELRNLPVRQWIAMAIIALGAQAFATVLFTQALSYAFPAHAAPDFNVENEVYLLYMLQPVFGIAMATHLPQGTSQAVLLATRGVCHRRCLSDRLSAESARPVLVGPARSVACGTV